MNNVTVFPKWRKNNTPAQTLAEVAQDAEAHPDEYKNVIIIYENADSSIDFYADAEIDSAGAVFLCEAAKLKILMSSGGDEDEGAD
jgi:hypothetical protein